MIEGVTFSLSIPENWNVCGVIFNTSCVDVTSEPFSK